MAQARKVGRAQRILCWTMRAAGAGAWWGAAAVKRDAEPQAYLAGPLAGRVEEHQLPMGNRPGPGRTASDG